MAIVASGTQLAIATGEREEDWRQPYVVNPARPHGSNYTDYAGFRAGVHAVFMSM